MNRKKATTIVLLTAGAVLTLATVNCIVDVTNANLEAKIKAEIERNNQLQAEIAEVERQAEMLQTLVTTIQQAESLARRYNTDLDIILLVYRMAEKYTLDVELLASVIQQESRFNPQAGNRNENGSYDRGLMQINSGTAHWLADQSGIDNFQMSMLYDPEVNMEMGSWYLRYLLNKYDDNLSSALTAYNRGPGGLQSYHTNTGTYGSRYSNSILVRYQPKKGRMASYLFAKTQKLL